MPSFRLSHWPIKRSNSKPATKYWVVHLDRTTVTAGCQYLASKSLAPPTEDTTQTDIFKESQDPTDKFAHGNKHPAPEFLLAHSWRRRQAKDNWSSVGRKDTGCSQLCDTMEQQFFLDLVLCNRNRGNPLLVGQRGYLL